jgi:hypothetical protein
MNRHATLASAAIGPSWNVIAYQVVLQIATQQAKSVRLFRVVGDGCCERQG